MDGTPRILRRFTPPPEPWLAGHRGIDLAAPKATPVRAAGPGTVRFAGPVAGKGVITIDHANGLRTTYLPVTPSVRRGESVTLGAKLGVIEATKPHCQESCLHWGLIRDTRYLNPLLLLGQAPTRLLPFWPSPTTALTPKSITPARPNTPAQAGPPEAPDSATHAFHFPTPGFGPTQPEFTPHTTTPPEWAATPTTNALSETGREAAPPAMSAETEILTTTTASPEQPSSPTQAIRLLTRSASTSTTTTAIIGLGTLLGAILLLIALRRRRRSDHPRTTTRYNPPRGQHRKGRGKGRRRGPVRHRREGGN
ncbi:peptidoglycan DD-metalloendopeptidase family protein [Nonomuraea sp. NPDC050643]|uniref:M23 family metallopeptidase n=1 Tax=Nonomuraea sp. NPDC050643 TaxID=3155660 RepID=UPI0033FEA376